MPTTTCTRAGTLVCGLWCPAGRDTDRAEHEVGEGVRAPLIQGAPIVRGAGFGVQVEGGHHGGAGLCGGVEREGRHAVRFGAQGHAAFPGLQQVAFVRGLRIHGQNRAVQGLAGRGHALVGKAGEDPCLCGAGGVGCESCGDLHQGVGLGVGDLACGHQVEGFGEAGGKGFRGVQAGAGGGGGPAQRGGDLLLGAVQGIRAARPGEGGEESDLGGVELGEEFLGGGECVDQVGAGVVVGSVHGGPRKKVSGVVSLGLFSGVSGLCGGCFRCFTRLRVAG